MAGEVSISLTKCPECRAELKLFTADQALMFACASCKKVIRRDGDSYKVLKSQTSPQKPLIPIGTRGKLKDVEYVLTGFMLRREAGSEYTWNEYTLFNPYDGYAVLSEFNGHWNFFKQSNKTPYSTTQSTTINYESHEYRIYNSYKAVTDYCEGEFSWNALEQKHCVEYINPPGILIKETSNDNRSWYVGQSIEGSEVKEAFKSQETFPEKIGVGSTQVFNFSFDFTLMKDITIGVLILVTILQIILTIATRDELVHAKSYSFIENDKAISGDRFYVNGDNDNLEITLGSRISNNWAFANISLINDDTGESYDMSKELSYYSGYEDGESWSEGSTSESLILNNIPRGVYHLNIIPSGGPGVNSLDIEIRREVPVYFNYIMTVILVLSFPVINHLRQNYFEKKRWMNSAYSQYDDDDTY